MKVQSELAVQIDKVEQLRREIDRATADGAADLQRMEMELAQARDRIHHMERSAFWRARLLWQRVRGSR